MNIGKVKW